MEENDMQEEGELEKLVDGIHISDLQAVDFAMGGVIVGAYDSLNDDKPAAFQRFLKREAKEKVFRIENDSPMDVLRRIAKRQSDKPLPDLPIVIYYRSPGIAGSDEKPVALDIDRYLDDYLRALRLSTVPVALTYTIMWCAWDKPTLDKMILAWHCHIALRGRKHSRFIVPYMLGEAPILIPASIIAPRDILTSNSSGDQGEGRLWSAQTQVDVSTQVLCGQEVKVVDEITAIGNVRLREGELYIRDSPYV